jgi:hypothetical protein
MDQAGSRGVNQYRVFFRPASLARNDPEIMQLYNPGDYEHHFLQASTCSSQSFGGEMSELLMHYPTIHYLRLSADQTE